MEIIKIVCGAYGVNTYLIIDEDSKEMAVIDPGGDGEEVIKKIEELKGNLKYVMLTHGHFDHTGGVYEIVKKYDAKLIVNIKDEEKILRKDNIYGPYSIKGDFIKGDYSPKDNDEFKIGEKKFKCIETPGHSPGGISYLIDGYLFSGDTLFMLSIGRTDLSGGDFYTLINSIKEKLFTLPEETIVYPGHGPKTIIKNEKKFNQFVR